MSEQRGDGNLPSELESSEQRESTTTRVYPILLENIETVEGRYVNLVNTNHDRASFQVVFSQFLQPVVANHLDAQLLEERNFVTAKVVARLVFTPLMIEETIRLLQYELDQFRLERASERKVEEQPFE